MSVANLFNGLSLGAILMIFSLGLALIYGLRGVANFAHGGLYMAGAYVAYTVTTQTTFWLALIAAPLVLTVVGVILEVVFFRRLGKRGEIEVGLLTFGLALVISRLVVIIWGGRAKPVPAPSLVGGSTSVFGNDYPTYRLFLLVFALVLAAAVVIGLRYSQFGVQVRAASFDPEGAAILGVNSDAVSLGVVALGSALAGIAGALVAPYLSATPDMGQDVLVTALIVVVIGGIGSVGGAMIAGMGLGILETLGQVWVSDLAVLIPFAALILVLAVRPGGLVKAGA